MDTRTPASRQDRPARASTPASRDDSQCASTPAPARPDKASRDDSAREPEPASAATGIQPRPQKLARKKAASIVDAAELVRHPDYHDNHQWILRSGDTVLGYVEPTYGGTSRSGRNGWTGRLGGHPGPRCKSRDGAAADLAMRWIQAVTTAPKRTLTGG